MKEISDIIKAYHTAKSRGLATVLATVVKVEGSSYRQPGARMLVTEEGQLTGAISGGCLEGDALKRALLAMYQHQNKLITYDTSNEDDAEFGIQLGCNGIVHILFEYLDPADENNPIALLEQVHTDRSDAVVAVLFSHNKKQPQHGTVLVYRNETDYIDKSGSRLHLPASEVLLNRQSALISTTIGTNGYEVLLEYIPIPLSLIIAGAGNDVKPLAKMASLIGWDITVVDGRASHARAERFPDARVLLARPEEVLNHITADSRTCFVLMTHNYKYDLSLLKEIINTGCAYIGTLGPKTKLERMLNDLHKEGIVLKEEQIARIYGPVGLDIGAETSEEIALSVTAEIKAVMSGRAGTSLRKKTDKIHTAIPHGINNYI